MGWIQNVPIAGVAIGNHRISMNMMLIQIVDPDMEFPKPAAKFVEVHGFKFLDLERDDPYGDEFKITPEQADQITQLLVRAVKEDMNVIVHCVAGVCRSGAVAEVGVILGLEDTGRFRSPNLLVKYSLLRSLGMTYDS